MVVVADAVDSVDLVSVTLSTGICVVETATPVLAPAATTVAEPSSAVNELIGVDVTLLELSIVVGTAEVDVSTTGTVDVIESEEDVDVTERTGVLGARGAEVDSACRTLEEVVSTDTAEEVADMVVDVVCVTGLVVVVLAGDEGVGKLVEECLVVDAGSDPTADVDVSSEVEVLKEVDTGTDVEKPSVVAVALPSVL